MQKKVQKHWSTLKIKGTDQAEFLRQLSTIVHGNDKRHLLMEKLRQNELLIELREQEIQRLAAIVFRSERGSPCSESDPSRRVLTLAVQQANPSRHFRLADDLVDKVVLDGEARGKNK